MSGPIYYRKDFMARGGINFYGKMDQQTLTVGVAEASFPSVSSGFGATQPEAIFVQAPSTNTVSVVIGKTGILSNLTNGGFEIIPGGNMTLPFNKDELLKAIASAAAQKLLITYLADLN